MNPIAFGYYGGKSSCISWLLPLLTPPIRVSKFCDLFCGSASVALNYAKAYPHAIVVINDQNSEVVTFFRQLRDNRDKLIESIMLSPYAKDEHTYCIKIDENDSETEVARKFFVRITQAFGASGKRNSTWSRTRDHKDGYNRKEMSRKLFEVADLFSEVVVDNRDAIGLVKFFGIRERNLLYLDPPYPHASRKSTDQYVHEMSDEQHIELLEAANACKSFVAISTYHNPLYAEALKDWKMHTVSTYTKFHSSRTNSRLRTNTEEEAKETARQEVLFTNYAPGGIIRGMF